ncbi:MAG: glycerophosphodiester phosphodiesterase family protein [Proteobacteria bacterium]|nr:glycerophosphodiester phosphodiesterase family protein [Pseudomonadota bacterium]
MKLHQENSLAGFRRAIELGIPAVELDVRLTADRVPVVLHDADLARLTGDLLDVRDLTWDQVSKLRLRREVLMGTDAAGRSVRVSYEQEERISQLAEVLAEIAPRIPINVELKLDFTRWWEVEVGTIVAKAIVDARVADRVIVTSFDPRKLRAVRRVARDLAVGFCFDDGMLELARPVLDRLPAVRDPRTADVRPGQNGRWWLTRLLDSDLVGRLLDTHVVGAEHTLIGHRTVERLHRKGVAIGTHTIFPLGSTTGKLFATSADQEAEVWRLVELGVDWIESDDPERLLALIG